MMWAFDDIWISLVVLAGTSGSSALHVHGLHNAQGINFRKLHQGASGIATHPGQWLSGAQAQASASQAPLAAAAVSQFPIQTFTQPLDHFYNTTDATFQQRFWVNTRHYKPRPGAPVIVIDGGEMSGEDRLPFLDTGIADILARATNGVAVVLEHRYYGACLADFPPGLGLGACTR
jgi:Serine carboxypeptidase S28